MFPSFNIVWGGERELLENFESMKVVYHLHGQTCLSTDWANGTQNSGLVNFVRRPEHGIKDGFEEMEHEFPFGISLPEKQEYLFRCSVLPDIFRWNDPKSCVPFTFQPDFPDNCGKW